MRTRPSDPPYPTDEQWQQVKERLGSTRTRPVNQFDMPSQVPDNPAIQFYAGLDSYAKLVKMPLGDHDAMENSMPNYTNSRLTNRWRTVGWGRYGLSLASAGTDLDNNQVYALGRATYDGPLSTLFVIDAKGRFFLNGKMTENERSLISGSTFLNVSRRVRQPVWWATAPDERSPDRDRFHRQIPYVPESLLSGFQGWSIVTDPGWWKLERTIDPNMSLAWQIVPSYDQAPPGTPMESTVGKYGHSQTGNSELCRRYDHFAALRAKRYRRAENAWLKRNGRPVLSAATPRMKAGQETLIGDEAVTAIMAAFDVKTPLRAERWRKEAHQEAQHE